MVAGRWDDREHCDDAERGDPDRNRQDDLPVLPEGGAVGEHENREHRRYDEGAYHPERLPLARGDHGVEDPEYGVEHDTENEGSPHLGQGHREVLIRELFLQLAIEPESEGMDAGADGGLGTRRCDDYFGEVRFPEARRLCTLIGRGQVRGHVPVGTRASSGSPKVTASVGPHKTYPIALLLP